ncbi:MAG: hypothetical protein J7L21_01650, partial [Sulfurimonas sp.]|nr:hypothetical protein [Sulfurimonas sp.]
MSNKAKAVVLISFLFILMNGVVYFVTETNKQERVNSALEGHIDKLKTHYEIVLEYQRLIADAIYKTTIMKDGVLEIFSRAWKSSDEKERTFLRKKLYDSKKINYNNMSITTVYNFLYAIPS